MRRRPTKPKMLDGAKWRMSHQATVDSVLARISEHRSVVSKGSNFFNRDSWTARAFVAALCEWARLNPGETPDRHIVEGWVVHANYAISNVPSYQRGITIASTPDELPRWLAWALVGGGYHEAWHTLYSRRTRLHISEVWPKVKRYWDMIPYDPENGFHGWSGLVGSVLHWGNIVEDIRIERCGCREFPGSPGKMEALQDLILKQEREGTEAMEHRGLNVNSDLTVVTGTFRDLGLGYRTPDQVAALDEYKQTSPEGYRFVDEGPLRPLLDRAITLGPEDDLDHLWIAMEIVASVVEATKPENPKESEDESEDGDKGQGSQGPPPDQVEASDISDGSDADAKPMPATNKPLLYKKGDRAVLKKGPHKGRMVEVTRASLPHPETGVQKLEFALVEDEAA